MKYYLYIHNGRIVFASKSDSVEYEDHLRRKFGNQFLYISERAYTLIKQFSSGQKYDGQYKRELCNFI